MCNDNLIIEKFNYSNQNVFKKRIKEIIVPSDCDNLSMQTFQNTSDFSKEIFILLSSEKQGLFKKRVKTKLIGYCIVFNLEKFNDNSVKCFSLITQIPDVIIKHYPTVISDFVITGNYRRKGIGKEFALNITNEFLNNKRISLMAVDDGLKFWDKVGFCFAENSKKIMYLPRS